MAIDEGVERIEIAARRPASRLRALVPIAVIGGIAVVLFVARAATGSRWSDVVGPGDQQSPRAALRFVTSWITWGAVAGLMALEAWRPAEARPSLLARGLLRDAAWAVSKFGLWWWLHFVYVGALIALATRTLGFTHPGWISDWPVVPAAVFAYLVSDFLDYWHHRLRHAVPALWRFHLVHHSAHEMNVFTDDRVHPVEYLVGSTVAFLPFFFLYGGDRFEVYALTVLIGWQVRFIHTNVRTDLGPLRYVFVTPQSHRVHHSLERSHYDCNFGVVLSVWDRCFGTHLPADGEYPSTGVREADFAAIEAMPGTIRPILQMLVAPFRRAPTPSVAVDRAAIHTAPAASS